MAIRAVLVEDNPGDARLIREMLRDTAVELVHAERLAAGIEAVAREKTDVVLLDLSLPDSSGLATFETMHAAAPDVAVVVLSGLDDESVAMHAVQQGAQDYLVKGKVEPGTLIRSVRYAVERQRLEFAALVERGEDLVRRPDPDEFPHPETQHIFHTHIRSRTLF